MEDLRRIGPHPGLQIVPTRDDSDLVAFPVEFVPGKHTMQFHGGPTIAAPKAVLLWCGTPAVDRIRFERFAYELVAFGYLAKLTYAGCSGGEWWGGFDGPALQDGKTYLDSDLQRALLDWLARHLEAPQPDGRTIYSLMLPAGVAVRFDGGSDTSCQAFCGYHSSIPAANVLYTVEPADSCSGCNQGDPFAGQCMVYSHEIAETASDPTGQGWYEDSTGMENADIVAWIPLGFGPWTVQGYASPDGQNLVGDYAPVSDPQPKPQGCQAAATALADQVISTYDAALATHPRSTRARYGKQGAVAVRQQLKGLPQ